MILDILNELSLLSNIPEINFLKESLDMGVDGVYKESSDIRPRDLSGEPGGFLELKGRRVVIIPDLHARFTYLKKIIFKFYNDLKESKIFLLFLGDYLHTEVTTRDRWLKAFNEYQNGFVESPNMDQEMRENLITVASLARLKSEFPESVYLLKGNHDNIYNSSEGGNRGFRKYVLEGEMVISYMKKKYGEELIKRLDRWEKLYPVFAVGKSFLASHAEPKVLYSRDEIINYKTTEDLIYNLTWTRNGVADPRITEFYISNYLEGRGKYIAGHRHVPGKYKASENGLFIQIHNPKLEPYFLIYEDLELDPESSLFILGESVG